MAGCDGENGCYGDVKGRLMPLVATSTADFLITYFAVHVAGAVAVPLHKDLPKGKLDEYSARLSRGSAPEGVADILYYRYYGQC